MENEKTITKVSLTYDDGTTREITKGFVCGFTKNEIEGTISSDMHLIDVAPHELETIVLLVLELAQKLNMFGTEDASEEADDDEA